MKILVFIQHDEDKINTVSLESLKAAQDISKTTNGKISTVIFNQEIGNQLQGYNVNEIIYVNDPKLSKYDSLSYIKAIEKIYTDESFDIIIVGHTYEARDWVPRLSARLDLPFISDCINFKNESTITYVRSVYQGKFNIDVSPVSKAHIVSFQSGAFRKDELESGSADIRSITIDFSDIPNIIEPEEKFKDDESSVDLTQAEIIVSVGRGIGKEENLPIAKELASALNAELASSRPVVDSGWLESYHQVGSSGQNVSPKLYFALGISGAIQHVVGMKGSNNIIVINKDSNAPIFEIADYGIVGDIFEIVPKLTEIINNN